MISNKNNLNGYYDPQFFFPWDITSPEVQNDKSPSYVLTSFNASTYTSGLDTARVLRYKMDNFYVLFIHKKEILYIYII